MVYEAEKCTITPMKIIFSLALLFPLALSAASPTPQEKYNSCVNAGRKPASCQHYLDVAGMTKEQRAVHAAKSGTDTSKKAANWGKK